MIILTDMEDDVNHTLPEFCEKEAEESIYISILGNLILLGLLS